MIREITKISNQLSVRYLNKAFILHYLTQPIHKNIVCQKFSTSSTKFRQNFNKKSTKISLQEYEAIKSRQNNNNTKTNQIILKVQQQDQKQNKNTYKNSKTIKQQQNNNESKCRCSGCNVYLQFSDKTKYGFVNEKIFKQSIQQNKQLINQTYGQKIKNKDTKIIDFLHQIQKQTSINIFKQSEKKQMMNLDNVDILLLLQQKIDRYEQQNQTLKKSKKLRKQIYCYRCHSLKYHNQLPSQYDNQIYEGGLNLDRKFVLQKVLKKHQNYKDSTHFLFLVDVLDIFGTLREQLIFELLNKNIPFSLVINKYDILNDKYLAHNLVHQQVRNLLKQHLKSYQKKYKQMSQFNSVNSFNLFNSQEKLKEIKIFFVSSISRQGVKKIQQFMNQGIIRLQLFGLPNTGKTSLLNKLLKSQKITSKIPGTTIRISQHYYRNKIKIFDMPGLHYPDLMYNLISKPSLKSILTWDKFYSPPLLTHSCFFYGGKVQAEGLRIIPFGLGGVCSSDNKWFIANYKQFWKGLPHNLKDLHIVKHQYQINFINGKSEDLQISGYGFISFKPCIKEKKNFKTKIVFYLPEKVTFRFRRSVLKQHTIFHNKSAFKKKSQLQRIMKNSMALNQ